MKKIALLTLIGCAAITATGFAAGIDSGVYDAATGKYTLSGTTATETPVRIEILKNGYIFEDLTLQQAESVYLYTDFTESGKDGSYSFTVPVAPAASNYSVRVSYFDGTNEATSFATYLESDMDTAIATYIANNARTANDLDTLITSYYGKMGVDYTKYRNLTPAAKTSMFTQLQTRIEANTSYSASDFKNYIKAFFIMEELNVSENAKVADLITSNSAILGMDTASNTWQKWTNMDASEKAAVAALVKAKQFTLNDLPKGFKDIIICEELKASMWNEQISVLEKYDAETNISASNWSQVTIEVNKKNILTEFKKMVDNGTFTDASTAKATVNSLILQYNINQNLGSGSHSGGGGGNYSVVGSNNVGTVTQPTVPFTDLDSVEWAKISIIALYNEGIVSGKAANSFCPQDYLTREELATMAVKAFDFELSQETVFADVASDRWSSEYIAAAKKAGVISGITENEFYPSENITRQDAAVILYRAAKASGTEIPADGRKEFADADSIADYAKDAVKALYNAGIVSGSGNGFEPQRNVTRAEVAKMIYEILKYCGGIK